MKDKLNILIACDANKARPWFRDRIPSIIDAIDKVEWSCEIIDIYGLLGEHEYMPTNVNVRKKFLQTCNMLQINKSFEDEIILKKPDVLILGTADNYIQFLLPSTVQNIRANGIIVIGILGDDEFNYRQYRFLLGWFDMFIAYVKPCVEYYESFNLSKGYYFPNSCFLNNKEFSDYSQVTKYDVVLVGAPIANRAEMVKGLIDSGLKVAIYGSQKWKEYDFTQGYYFGFVDTEEFDNVLSDAKIVLAFLEDHLTGALHMNTKIWEAVRVARLPVVTFYDRLIKDYNLTDGVDIVMYKSTQDLIKKVNFYVKNDNERIKISEALYCKVQNNFEYSMMYENLFNYLMRQLGDKSKVKQEINVKDKLKSEKNIMYFDSKKNKINIEVLNHIEILKKLNVNNNKIDYVYYSKVENGKQVIQRWPFISPSSIIFLTTKKYKIEYIYIYFISYFRGRAVRINQFCISSDYGTILGKINRHLYPRYRKFLKKYLVRNI